MRSKSDWTFRWGRKHSRKSNARRTRLMNPLERNRKCQAATASNLSISSFWRHRLSICFYFLVEYFPLFLIFSKLISKSKTKPIASEKWKRIRNSRAHAMSLTHKKPYYFALRVILFLFFEFSHFAVADVFHIYSLCFCLVSFVWLDALKKK